MNTGLNNKIFLALIFFGLLFAGNAQAIVINTTVPGSDNLYFDDWGHPFVTPGSNAGYALGRGTAPSAVSYAFSSGQALDITAGNCVVDAGASCTGPDGSGSLFRGLPVYSLIGVWSSSLASINPVEGGTNPAFWIGSFASLVAPVYAGSTYLFLGENDGIFADNTYGQYDVTITTASVPEPASLALLGLGLVGMGFARKRRNA